MCKNRKLLLGRKPVFTALYLTYPGVKREHRHIHRLIHIEFFRASNRTDTFLSVKKLLNEKVK